MPTIDVLDAAGAKAGTAELPAEIFDVQVNVPLIHQVVVAQLAAARQGTHATKNRGEVRGGGRKPYKQKGTGRARQGSTRAPQFTGGGVVHGPTPRDYSQRTPKKMKAAALRGALSDRARHGRVHVLSALVDGEAPSTKAAVAALAGVSAPPAPAGGAGAHGRRSAGRACATCRRVHAAGPDQLNTYDVLCADDVVFTSGALAAFLAGPPQGEGRHGVGDRRGSEAADERDGGAHRDPRDILLTPVVSEKSYSLLDEGKYTFIVDPRANKTEIRIAVEKVFGVKVKAVNTLNRQGKLRRTRIGTGQRKDTKRAIVTLREGTIDIFGGPVA